MGAYVCDTCDKVFTQKGHYDSHKARKRPCKKNDAIEKLIEKKVQEALRSRGVATGTGTAQVEIIKPFMKWVGGKTQIIHEVMAAFPREMHNYHEPFLGGGSVLLALLSHKRNGTIQISGKIYASDLNSNLIALYKNVQSHPDALIAEVKKLSDEFATCNGMVVNRKATTMEEALTSPESYYYWIRSRFNAFSKEERTSVVASAMLLFLNKTCFRGVYREGPRGFNVPFGNYQHPSILDDAHIRTVSECIQEVVFTTEPYDESLSRCVSGDFVYLDPPYAPENNTSFVSYTSDGFNLDNHKKLFELCGTMTSKNIKMLMSNADVTLVKNVFPSSGYVTKIISCRRAIHSKEPNARANEVLITNRGI